jgi:outer membrane protein TolC
MNKKLLLGVSLLFWVNLARGEEIRLTLAETIRLAASKSLSVRLAQARTEAAATSAFEKAQFYPRVSIGTGVAGTYGFPMSIEGSAPAVVEADFVQTLYHRTQRKRLESARLQEDSDQARLRSEQEDAAFRAGAAYLELRNARRRSQCYGQTLASLQKIATITQARVEAGVAHQQDRTLAELEAARAKADQAAADQETLLLEEQLGQAIDVPPAMALVLAEDDRPGIEGGYSPDQLVQACLESDPLLRVLRLQEQANQKDVEAWQGWFKPVVQLVGKYGLFSRFNNYDEYFSRFQRNNALFGAMIQLPLFNPDAAPELRRAKAALRATRLMIEARSNQVRLEARRLIADAGTLAARQEVARLELLLAHQNLEAAEVRYAEGKAALTEVERARSEENAKRLQLLDVQLREEKTRLELQKQLGKILPPSP